MITIAEIKNRAVSILQNKWLNAALATLVVWVLLSCISFPFKYFGNLLVLQGVLPLVLAPLGWGLYAAFLYCSRDKNINLVTTALCVPFSSFTTYFKWLCTIILAGILQLAASLLLIVPGIILACGWAFVPFVLADNPTMGILDALSASWDITKGYKMKIFLLQLSMIGWIILSIVTLGIGFLFLTPYYYTSLAVVYEEVKDKK